jgi:energy-coupling factor transporter ATP-binding protein EcfA2
MQNSVELDKLSKTFVLNKRRGFRRITDQVLAVNGISLAIPAGQSVAFIGPNGAGKSTTIKMLTGILHPTSGQAQVLGFTPWQERNKLTHHIGNAMITFTTYPAILFEGLVKLLLYTLIPAGFISYLPVEALRQFSLGHAALALAGAFAMLAISGVVFYHGLRRYESGNLTEMRG